MKPCNACGATTDNHAATYSTQQVSGALLKVYSEIRHPKCPGGCGDDGSEPAKPGFMFLIAGRLRSVYGPTPTLEKSVGVCHVPTDRLAKHDSA